MYRLNILALLVTFIPNTLLASISLEEKIASMLLLGIEGQSISTDNNVVNLVKQYPIGGIILFKNNIASKHKLKSFIQQLQSINTKVRQPLFIAIDYEGGSVDRFSHNSDFPSTLSARTISVLGAQRANKQANNMVRILQDVGINMNLAPVIDVDVNSESPAIGNYGRSYSPDPSIVSQYARIFAQAHHANNIICTLKHFPGHGSATHDSHLEPVDVSTTWQEYELAPYYDLLNSENSCQAVMVAHVHNDKLDPKYPASLSRKIITKILRNKMQFQGLVIVDDLQMKAITAQYGLRQAVILAINAGADLLLFSGQIGAKPAPNIIIKIIKNAIKKGEINIQRINESNKRIVTVKKKLKWQP